MRTFVNAHNGHEYSTADEVEIERLEQLDNWSEVDTDDDRTPYAKLKVEQLKALCAERELEVAENAKKADLVAALEQADAAEDEE